MLSEIAARKEGTDGQVAGTTGRGFIQQPERLLINVLARVQPLGIVRSLAPVLSDLLSGETCRIFRLGRVQGIERGGQPLSLTPFMGQAAIEQALFHLTLFPVAVIVQP